MQVSLYCSSVTVGTLHVRDVSSRNLRLGICIANLIVFFITIFFSLNVFFLSYKMYSNNYTVSLNLI